MSFFPDGEKRVYKRLLCDILNMQNGKGRGNMKIHVKLVGFVSVALIVPLLLGVFYVRHFGQRYYQKQQGIIHLMIAEELAGTLQDGIRQKFEQVLNWVAIGPVASLASSASPPQLDMETVLQIESRWSHISQVGGTEQAVLLSPVSAAIRSFQQLNPEFAEILMTDRYGLLIGASNPTTDYWQADEEWWMSASVLPAGKGRIPGLVYDESAGGVVIDMTFPVYSAGVSPEFLGILKASLNATRFLPRAAPRPWSREIARDLVYPDGKLFVCIDSGDSPEFLQMPEESLRKLLNAPDHWDAVEIIPGTLSLAAIAPIHMTVDSMDHSPTGEVYAVVSRDLTAAMMPVHDMLSQLTVWGIAVTLLIALIGYLLATFWFARPIKKLRNASQSFVHYIKQSEEGRFEDAWESRQEVRRRMNELDTIRNRDELQGLARDFTRMGDRMLGFFRKIEERLTDKKQE